MSALYYHVTSVNINRLVVTCTAVIEMLTVAESSGPREMP